MRGALNRGYLKITENLGSWDDLKNAEHEEVEHLNRWDQQGAHGHARACACGALVSLALVHFGVKVTAVFLLKIPEISIESLDKS